MSDQPLSDQPLSDQPLSDQRSIELEIEVPGTPEEVWEAIASGPGISSWYVPHTVEEREGGVATARFGPGPEMEVPGRVAAWEPLKRIVFDGGEGVGGMAFEWLVEAQEGGTCIVRLVNSGFGSGDDWDAQYDAMHAGWMMFLQNLKMHLEHFSGQAARASLPTGTWPGPRDAAWNKLTSELGVASAPAIGDRIDLDTSGGPSLGGTVVDKTPFRLSILVDTPALGTALMASESMGDTMMVSIWSYLYGEDGAAVATRDEPLWQQWLDKRAAPPS